MRKLSYLKQLKIILVLRKKADWAVKWIQDKRSSFATRLLAFACVEGVFLAVRFVVFIGLRSVD